MKKKLLSVTIAVLLGAAVCGCGSDEPEVLATIEAEPITPSVGVVEKVPVNTEEPGEPEAPIETEVPAESEEAATAQETKELTFEDLSKRQFGFSSGAGAWGEEFTIERDGYFTGKFHDAEMGSIGEGYENGTFYYSSYSGHFTDLVKVNAYTYEMKLKDISYREDVDTQRIVENQLYIYTDSYALGGNDTFTVYLPGAPLDAFSEELWMWIRDYNQSETELTMPIIVDEENGYAMYSYERLSAAEDAKSTLAIYQESFDYYWQLVSEGSTTMEWLEYTGRLCELSDECLNYLWNLIRYNVEEVRYREILTEQRAWIKEKEAAAAAARDAWEGGSFAPVDYNDTLATMTIERCRVLVEYLQ